MEVEIDGNAKLTLRFEKHLEERSVLRARENSFERQFTSSGCPDSSDGRIRILSSFFSSHHSVECVQHYFPCTLIVTQYRLARNSGIGASWPQVTTDEIFFPARRRNPGVTILTPLKTRTKAVPRVRILADFVSLEISAEETYRTKVDKSRQCS